MRRPWIIALLLAAGTLALYWPVRCFDLIYFDDPLLLQNSPEIQAGLTWTSFKWAWTSVVIANWQPLTNLSFLAVSQFFGTAPGAHHLANAAIHAANAALVFLLLLSAERAGRGVALGAPASLPASFQVVNPPARMPALVRLRGCKHRGWKSLTGGASRRVTERNCVVATRGGEQLEVNG